MSYATPQQLIEQLGENEVIPLTDRELSGGVNVAVAEGALQRASDEMDGYLAARYPLPLSNVPRRLSDLCCDIARYKLSGAGVTELDIVRLRYKDAIRDLERIRDGSLDIGLTVAGTPPAGNASVQFSSAARVFNGSAFSGY
jgi:phage gp36-like protein